MIREIILEECACFKERTKLVTDKPINLIYGLNGTGKTVLSNYLQFREHSSRDDQSHEEGDKKMFSKCDLKGLDEEKNEILVYNQNFIEKNFIESPTLEGVFSLSEENVDIQKQVTELEEAQSQLQRDKEEREELKKGTQEKKEAAYENATDEVFKLKHDVEENYRSLRYCLEGKKSSKKNLFEYICALPESTTLEPPKELRILNEEAATIKEAKGEIHRLKDLHLDNIHKIEDNQIFKEIIQGSQDSPVSDLIKKLQNSDWVKQGLKYLNHDHSVQSLRENGTTECPFCQQTITDKIKSNIENYFDQTFENKMNVLKEERSKYSQASENLKDFTKDTLNHSSNTVFDRDQNAKPELLRLCRVLKECMERNLQKIESKIESPGKVIEFEYTKNQLHGISESVSKINNEIDKFNREISNKEVAKKRIKEEFRKRARYDYRKPISEWQTKKGVYEGQSKEIGDQLRTINEKIGKNKGAINTLRQNTVNIHGALENINNGLNVLTDGDLSIMEADKALEEGEDAEEGKGKYRLVRNNGKCEFKTLSEGEKTLISFLYFLQLCHGQRNPSKTFLAKIIFIDDPISSLSHIHVFNIATLIRDELFSKINNPDSKNNTEWQIFLSTHNLYFFEEIRKQIESSRKREKQERKRGVRKLFRIMRGNSSEIREMKDEEIQNEYQSYWQIIKDWKKNPEGISRVLVANSMRNILEYFFGFIDKNTLGAAIQNLGRENRYSNAKYQAFKRLMNRESHLDSANIYDSKEIFDDIENIFKEVFCKSGYEGHYNRYMK